MKRAGFVKRTVIVIACLVNSAIANGAVIATDNLIMPLSPSAVSNRLSLHASQPVDPARPVWVVYQVFAVSASSDAEGEIVIDAALEGVPVSISDQFVVFEADKLKSSASAGTIAEQLEAQVGQRSPEELEEAFGPEIYAAYVALNKKQGAILQGAILKEYGPTNLSEVILLATVERAVGIHPMLVNVIMGQGDLPAEYAASLQSKGMSPFARSAIALAVLFVALYVVSRLRRR